MLIPFIIMTAVILSVFVIYTIQYAQVSGNITTASRFNHNFKDEVDLKMYSFVSGSRESKKWRSAISSGGTLVRSMRPFQSTSISQ